MKPRLIIEQKITAFVNKYAVYRVNENGSKGDLAAFAQQKRFNIREKFIFYTDEAKTQTVFTMRAEKVLDIHGRFLVEDPDGQLIGAFKKEFAQSLINSTWTIIGKDGQPKLQVSESNHTLAVIRRFGSLLPIIGGLIDLLVVFLRYHFSFIDLANNQEVGTYTKTTLFRDRYRLEMTDDIYDQTDWRLLSAMAVALDALQSR